MIRTVKYFFLISTLLFIPFIFNFAYSLNTSSLGSSSMREHGLIVRAPIDSGVIVLLSLGVIYGALKLYQQNAKRNRAVGGRKVDQQLIEKKYTL
jgi:hypothetical protein